MAKAELESWRVLQKLERIEKLLEDLLSLQGCKTSANRQQLAKWIGIDKKRVSRISKILRSGARIQK